MHHCFSLWQLGQHYYQKGSGLACASGGPGTYTYGDPAHLHAATAVGSGYTASYDAARNMICRGPSCPAFTQSDAFLSYDHERRQVGWSQGSSSATYAYDGEGQRVAQQSTVAGTVSTTRYLAGGLEEVTTSGSPSITLTKYESVPGVCSVVIVGSGPSEAISYVTTDGLGSVSEALDGNGNVTAQQLYGPYGGVRYSSGAMPTSKGYTGQYADATTGLDYYSARYYDPLVGQFTSADSAGDDLNRYAYVHDDPETATDPTGQRCVAGGGACPPGGGGGSGGSGGSGGGGKVPCVLNCGSPGGEGGCTSENCGGGCYSSCNPAACAVDPGLCASINATFHNQNTRDTLYELLLSSIGRALLGFLLAVGRVIGDAFISWASLPCNANGCQYAYTSYGGLITLSTQLTPGADAAPALVHEAVEAYYAIEWGIRTFASQRMDYLAQWYAGEFEAQHGGYAYDNGYNNEDNSFYRAYGLTFDQWTKTSDFGSYSGELPTQAGTPLIDPGWVFTPGWFGAEDVPHLVGRYGISALNKSFVVLLGIG